MILDVCHVKALCAPKVRVGCYFYPESHFVMHLHHPPFFHSLAQCKRILLAGAGGGWDVLCAIPLMSNLLSQGKEVVLANFSFTWLDQTTAKCVFLHLYEIMPDNEVTGERTYFPEKWLAQWLRIQQLSVPLFAFERTGPASLAAAYRWIMATYEVDAIVLVDGGTDILMLGDEEGLGTPQEDMCSLAAVHSLAMENSFVACLGFGIDHFHGVSHFRFLENVSELIRKGGFLGSFHLLGEMPEAQAFLEVVRYMNLAQPDMEGIVANSIASSLEGKFGDDHFTDRTAGSELFINALMTQYWTFHLPTLASANRFLGTAMSAATMAELNARMKAYRDGLPSLRSHKSLPL
jgi:hypothetical protein